eukprot:273136-Prymnesium_polylepis.1
MQKAASLCARDTPGESHSRFQGCARGAVRDVDQGGVARRGTWRRFGSGARRALSGKMWIS